MNYNNENPSHEDKKEMEIPDWQKKAALQTLKEVKDNPKLSVLWEEVKKKYQRKNDENE
jgi:hypothetical protein